jgi:hypothetical protein
VWVNNASGDWLPAHEAAHIDLEAVSSAVFWREACGGQKLPGIRHALLKNFCYLYISDNNTCFYGKCYYCKGPEDGVCADGDILEGTMVLWLPTEWKLKNHPHPWRRTYKKSKHAK